MATVMPSSGTYAVSPDIRYSAIAQLTTPRLYSYTHIHTPREQRVTIPHTWCTDSLTYVINVCNIAAHDWQNSVQCALVAMKEATNSTSSQLDSPAETREVSKTTNGTANTCD